MFDEVAASALPGLIFTYVWAFDQPTDAAAVESYAAPFRARGGRVVFVELEADQDERLRLHTTTVSAAEVAERVIAHFGLPRLAAPPLAT